MASRKCYRMLPGSSLWWTTGSRRGLRLMESFKFFLKFSYMSARWEHTETGEEGKLKHHLLKDDITVLVMSFCVCDVCI